MDTKKKLQPVVIGAVVIILLAVGLLFLFPQSLPRPVQEAVRQIPNAIQSITNPRGVPATEPDTEGASAGSSEPVGQTPLNNNQEPAGSGGGSSSGTASSAGGAGSAGASESGSESSSGTGGSGGGTESGEPLPTGGQTETGTANSCGDGLCAESENCLNCALDCGECSNTDCEDNGGVCQASCANGFVEFLDGSIQCQPTQICCVAQSDEPPSGVCGNGIIESGEACECGPNGICGDNDDDLTNQTCVTQGFESGELYCSGNCATFNTMECIPFWER